MIDPFDSYKLYNALKLHFETDGYDAIKYNYKSNDKQILKKQLINIVLHFYQIKNLTNLTFKKATNVTAS